VSTVSAGTGHLPDGELLRPSTVAKAIGVHRNTIYRWASERGGALRDQDFVRVGPRKRLLRIRRKAALRLMGQKE